MMLLFKYLFVFGLYITQNFGSEYKENGKINCPAGFSCQDLSKIEPCPKGTFSHGIGICITCAPGFFADKIGSDRCEQNFSANIFNSVFIQHLFQ